MKKDIHPKNHRKVIFLDTSSDAKFLLSSTVETQETTKWEDGKEYPLYKIEISSSSHPFYTGTDKIIDTSGRVDKFKRRQSLAQSKTKGNKKSASK